MLKLSLAVVFMLLGIYLYGYSELTVQSVFKYIPFFENSYQKLADPRDGVKQIKKKKDSRLIVFTEDELKRYINKETGLYLSILGEVYDVSKGEQHYGPGGSYHFFTGRDASRAFVTGDFTVSGLIDDVLDLDPHDIKSLFKWVSLYKKQYKYKGKLIGRYFDSKGNPTVYKQKVENKFNLAVKDDEAKHEENLRMPPCNTEWSVDQGTRVWCTKMSGGIQRDWVGVPRKVYTPGSDSYRCACVNMDEESNHHLGNMKEYPDCNPKATSCTVNSDS